MVLSCGFCFDIIKVGQANPPRSRLRIPEIAAKLWELMAERRRRSKVDFKNIRRKPRHTGNIVDK